MTLERSREVSIFCADGCFDRRGSGEFLQKHFKGERRTRCLISRQYYASSASRKNSTAMLGSAPRIGLVL
jgi:hypothetical protein